MALRPEWLKTGGFLAYTFYEADFWPKLQPLKWALRLVTTPHLPTAWTLSLCKILVAALTRDQPYAWALLDTVDWYGPRHEIRQNHLQVNAVLEERGLQQVPPRWPPKFYCDKETAAPSLFLSSISG